MDESRFLIAGKLKCPFEGDATFDWKKDRLAKTAAYYQYFIEIQIKDGSDTIMKLELEEEERGYSIGWDTHISFEEFFELSRSLYGQRINQQKASVNNVNQGGIYLRYPSKVASGTIGARESIVSAAKGEDEKPDHTLETFLKGNIAEISLPRDEEYSLRIYTAFFRAHYTDNNQGEKTIAFASQFNMANNLADLFSKTSIKRYEVADIKEIDFILRQLLGRYPS